MPMLKNVHLAGLPVMTAWGEIAFDAEGLAEVSDEAAEALVTIPGFELAEATAPADDAAKVDPPKVPEATVVKPKKAAKSKDEA